MGREAGILPRGTERKAEMDGKEDLYYDVDGRCASVARKLVIAAGGNVFDDYFTFYQDGKWLVEVVRTMQATLSRIASKPENTVVLMPKVEECLGHLSNIGDVPGMGVQAAVAQAKANASSLREASVALSSAVDDKTGEAAASKCRAAADVFRKYLAAYEQSCVNVMRERYVGDELDVKGLLDTIHESGNYVLNKDAGEN